MAIGPRIRARVRRLARYRPVLPDPGFDADRLESRLVWVFGSPRSGSTWLMRMLRRHPGVVTINETGIGQHLADLGSEESNGSIAYFRTTERRRSDANYFFSEDYEYCWRPLLRTALLGRLHAQVGAAPDGQGGGGDPLVVIKEPNGSHAADLVMRLLPRSRLLFLLRDGRDVVDSQLDAVQHGEWVGRWGPQGAVPDEQRLEFVRANASLWVYRTEVVQRAYAETDPGRRLLVRYEELRADAREWMRRIVAWLGLPVEDALIAEIVEAESFERVPAEQKGSGKQRRVARPGFWRESLSPEEQELAQRIMGEKLRELGYDA